MTKGQEMNQPVTGDVMSAEEVALERRARRFTLFAMAVLLGVALLGVLVFFSVFVGAAMIAAGLAWKLLRGRQARAAASGRVVDAEYRVLRKPVLPSH